MILALLLACTGHEPGDSAPAGDDSAPTSSFATVVSERVEAVLCVRGTSTSDVWAVGADMGSGPLVLHYDGTAWTQLHTGTTGDLWSIQPFADGATMVGDHGVIVSYDAASGAFTSHPGPSEISLLGVWGASPDDLWATGGDLVRVEDPAVWRNVTGEWAQYVDDTTKLFGHKTYLTGVSGAAADDLWIIGTQEILAHWDGDALDLVERGNKNDLTAIHMGGTFPVTVGGLQSAYILQEEAGDWVDRSPDLQPQLKGVWGQGEQMIAVGARGVVLRWDGSAWVADAVPVTFYDLTSVWIDPEGGVWVGGGDTGSQPQSRGFVGYEGDLTISPG
jgi:hypothetical protein